MLLYMRLYKIIEEESYGKPWRGVSVLLRNIWGRDWSA